METPKEICAICLGGLRAGEGQALFTAECSHTFHFPCIASNVQHGNHICPTCRSVWRNLPSQFTPSPNYFSSTLVPPISPLSPSFADDEPLPSLAPAAPTSSSAPPRPPQGDYMMTVKAMPEYPALVRSEQSNSFVILVGIGAPPLSPEASDRPNVRAPLDLVAVLDVSGSMHGDKIRLLKQAVGFVVDNLGPTDRLSLITFSTSARRITPLRRMTDAGQADTTRAVDSLRANGSTNIIAGLEKAVEVLEQRRQRNPVASIILLSDGHDNQNGHGSNFLQSLQHLPLCFRSNTGEINSQNQMQADMIPVHTFGFGSDHDATALHAIADGSAGGTFSYIESIEIIQDAFAQCIGGLLSVVAQEVEIQVQSGSYGVRIQSISSGRYQNRIDSEAGQNGVVYVGDVYAEEEKQFLVYLSVPPAHHDTLTTQLLEVKCSYKDPLSNERIMSETVSVEIRRPETNALTEEDRRVCLEVDRERNRVSIAEGIAQAQAMAERGEMDGAQSLLARHRRIMLQSASAQAGDTLCNWLDGEVREIQERMVSRTDYEAGGRAYAFSRRSSHMYQRASTQAVRSKGAEYGPQSAAPSFGSAALAAAAAAAPPPPAADGRRYQTSFMRNMVKKSQELRLYNNQDEQSSGNSNTSKP